MKHAIAAVLLVASLHSPAAADVYDDVHKLAAPRADNELSITAAARWQRGRAELTKVPAAKRQDYRYCTLDTLLAIRIEGPDAAASRRFACTALLVEGKVHGATKTLTAIERAAWIDTLSRAADDHRREELAEARRRSLFVPSKVDTCSGVHFKAYNVVLDQLSRDGKLDPDTVVLLRALADDQAEAGQPQRRSE